MGDAGRATFRWEAPAALACGLLAFVPGARIPAAFLLLAILPGAAIARHRLGERGLLRVAILGSLLSLAVVPTTVIPIALLAGRADPAWTVPLVVALTFAACARPRPAAEVPPLPRGAILEFGLLASIQIAMQAAATIAIFSDRGTIRWRGLPDMVFFKGIVTQLALAVPPLDPDNGAGLLIHNWTYHFHHALFHQASGLEIFATQRIVGAWLALALLGIVYLIGADILRRPWAGAVAALLVMAGGQVRWLAAWIVEGRFPPSLPWDTAPFGLTLLIGWYNLAPLATALAVWYFFERHRRSGGTPPLVAALGLAVALAFYHPVFYAVLMLGMGAWILVDGRAEGLRPSWLLFFLTPVPFALFYVLPYFGLTPPPSVMHFDPDPAAVFARFREFVLWAGAVLALGAIGMFRNRPILGPASWIVAASLFLRLFVRIPNPHWFDDLMFLALACAAGLAADRIGRRWRAVAVAAVAIAAALGLAALSLHFEKALLPPHHFAPGEIEAAEWLKARTGPGEVVAIVPNSFSHYAVVGLAGRRVAHGWTEHLADFHHDARERERTLRAALASGDPELVARVMRQLGARWFWLGPADGHAVDTGGLTGACFEPAFDSGPVAIYALTC